MQKSLSQNTENESLWSLLFHFIIIIIFYAVAR